MVPRPTKLTRTGTDPTNLRFGVPVSEGAEPNGYRFEGRQGVEVALDGTEFSLGTFVHENYPTGGVAEG